LLHCSAVSLQAAEAVELPCKNLIARGSYSVTDPERLAVLNRFCLGDREPLETLITQFKEFARFMEFDAAKNVSNISLYVPLDDHIYISVINRCRWVRRSTSKRCLNQRSCKK
jgi:hypothetical protein